MSPVEQVEMDWPALDPASLSDWIGRALNIELAPQRTKIKERQQLFLRRELNRIDEYLENYARELGERSDRQHKAEAIKRSADRLEATRWNTIVGGPTRSNVTRFTSALMSTLS